jgi:glycerol-3-phosphate dehydrogenase
VRAPPPPLPFRRERALERLDGGAFDVLVVGAGIVGARVALEAAVVGLKVALVDAGDFGGATSSASGKLVHGGLRYLRSGRWRLVREARRERRILAERVAPHLVRRMPLLLAADGGALARYPTIAAAPLAYWALDRFRGSAPRFVAAGEVAALVEPLRTAGLGTHVLLEESVTNDGRLTLATVRAAARAGAVAVNYVRAIELESTRGRMLGAVLEETGGEGRFTVRCRAVVNATGPWLDQLRLLEDPKREPAVRLSKGVHVALPLEGEWWAAFALDRGGTGHFYAVPWHGTLLLGTTDSAYRGDPGAVAPEPAEQSQLLQIAASILSQDLVRPDRVRCAFAGLRALPSGDGGTYETSREHFVLVGPAGMVSVGGGKLTTHRLAARDALRRLPADLRPRRLRPDPEPLPGASPPAPADLLARLDAPTAEHLVSLYGGEAGELPGYAARSPDALERVHPAGPDIWAQVYHAAERESAVTVEDVTRRRTTLDVRGLDTDEIRRRISSIVAASPASDASSLP